jgi:2-haloacid dehalogenase
MEQTMSFRPKFVSFDCYGTMINFDMAGAARDHYSAKLTPEQMNEFVRHFSAYRLDEVLDVWKPYAEIVHNSVERTCKRMGIAFDPEVAVEIYNRVPTWGPHADVPAGLAKVAKEFPLVALTNAMNEQIPHNIAKLGAPITHVLTAQDAGAYKPHMRAFEYMFDTLGCAPEDFVHVSSSFRYDHMTAYDAGIKDKVWVNRGHEPANPFYGYVEAADLSGLVKALGL